MTKLIRLLILAGLGILATPVFADGALVAFPRQFLVDTSGNPRIGAKAYVYDDNTTTPRTIYTTSTLATPRANPVVSAGDGIFPAIYLNSAGGEYKIVIVDADDVPIYTEDDIVPPTTLTQSSVAAILNPQTPAELAAGVTPTNYACVEATPCRYGIAGNGTTDDTDALADLLHVGFQGVKVDFGADLSIVTAPFTMNATNENVPPGIVGYNITFKAKAGSTGNFITIENPQDTWDAGFTWTGFFIFDSNALTAQAFVVHGVKHAKFGPMRFINSVGAFDGAATFNCQAKISAEALYGVYYTIFEGWVAGFSTATGGTGCGIGEVASDDTNRIASNLWLNPKAAFNDGPGYYIHHSSDTFIGAEAEKNDKVGVSVDFSTSLSWFGGYTEHNDQSFAGDNTTDGSPDLSITLTSDSNRVMIFGGRHVGDVTGEELGSGNVTLPGTAGGLNITQTGIGFGGTAAVDNGLNFSNASDIVIRATGTTKWRWVQSSDTINTQVALNAIGGVRAAASGTLDTKAVLETASTTKYSVPCPLMTGTQRDAISTPAEGACVWNTTTHKQNVYDGSAWVATH